MTFTNLSDAEEAALKELIASAVDRNL